MKNSEQIVENVTNDSLRVLGLSASLRERRLREFEIPIAEVIPCKVINRIARFCELEALEIVICFFYSLVKSRENPVVNCS